MIRFGGTRAELNVAWAYTRHFCGGNLKIPAKHMDEIVNRKRGLSADTALRLARHFGTSAELWMNLQTMYDLDRTRLKIGKALDRIPQRPKEQFS